jgi:hypothetical protein
MRDPAKTTWREAKAEALRLARLHGEDYRIIKRKSLRHGDDPDGTAGSYVVVTARWVEEFKSKPQPVPLLFSVQPFIAFASTTREMENHAG